MSISEIVIFIISCIIFYIIGNSLINFIGKCINKLKSKKQPKAVEVAKVGDEVEGNS